MASINAVLTAENGDDLYPETYDDYVLDSNGEALSTRLGSRSEASGVSGTSAFAKINTLSSDLTDKVTYLSNSSTATTLETKITPGQNFTVPNDGYYLLSCYNTADNTRSANFSLNGTNIIRNSKPFGLYAFVPLKKGAVLTTRANTSGSNDDFHYTVASSFIP